MATPIGNLGDLAPRAREVLASAAVVAAEDTRRTGQLLARLGLERPLVSLHEHNERRRIDSLLGRLHAGEDVAVVSDAGTPLVSDPGLLLVRAANAAGIEVRTVPGPCAAIAAISVAGLPTDRFVFEGFLPSRAAARRARLDGLRSEPRSLVFYEAPQRLADSLDDMAGTLGETRRAVVARELTKLHESVYHGTLRELADRARGDPDMSRGEIVVVVEGARAPSAGTTAAEIDRVLRILLKTLPPSQAAAIAAELTGAGRNACYARAMSLREP